MSISARAPRPPAASGGGRALLLLGVLLALAAGAIAVFVVSQHTGLGGQTETVVVATKDILAGTKLTANGDTGSDAIPADFAQQSVNYAPANAYLFTSEAALQSALNNEIVTQTIYKGDFLFTGDPRLSTGGGQPGSLTNINPTALSNGDVLFALNLQGGQGGQNSKPFAVAGDHIDILVTECNLPNINGCVTQTTLKNIYVYAVTSSQVVLVLTHQQSIQLLYLWQTGNGEIVVRKPGDSGVQQTIAVDGASIVTQFQY